MLTSRAKSKPPKAWALPTQPAMHPLHVPPRLTNPQPRATPPAPLTTANLPLRRWRRLCPQARPAPFAKGCCSHRSHHVSTSDKGGMGGYEPLHWHTGWRRRTQADARMRRGGNAEWGGWQTHGTRVWQEAREGGRRGRRDSRRGVASGRQRGTGWSGKAGDSMGQACWLRACAGGAGRGCARGPCQEAIKAQGGRAAGGKTAGQTTGHTKAVLR